MSSTEDGGVSNIIIGLQFLNTVTSFKKLYEELKQTFLIGLSFTFEAFSHCSRQKLTVLKTCQVQQMTNYRFWSSLANCT